MWMWGVTRPPLSHLGTLGNLQASRASLLASLLAFPLLLLVWPPPPGEGYTGENVARLYYPPPSLSQSYPCCSCPWWCPWRCPHPLGFLMLLLGFLDPVLLLLELTLIPLALIFASVLDDFICLGKRQRNREK